MVGRPDGHGSPGGSPGATTAPSGDPVTRRVLDEKTDAESGSEPKPAPVVGAWNLPEPRWLAWALVGVAALVFAAWLFLAVAHVDDRFQLDHVSGARMALAQYFDEGTLYPELYEAGSTGAPDTCRCRSSSTGSSPS